MRKFGKVFSVFSACAVVGMISLYIGFSIISGAGSLNKPNISNNIGDTIKPVDTIETKTLTEKNENNITENKKIEKSTVIVYEYYNISTDQMETEEEEPPYFMLDFTEQDLQNTFKDWTIISFDNKKVVMRKNFEEKKIDNYIVGAQQGYVAIYYRESENKSILKEITDIPLSSLPIAEQQRLLNGIDIVGEDKLLKVLEDYGS